MELHRAAALTAIVAVVAVNIGNANPLDREEGNASISIEHYHQEPRSDSGIILDHYHPEPRAESGIIMDHPHKEPRRGGIRKPDEIKDVPCMAFDWDTYYDTDYYLDSTYYEEPMSLSGGNIFAVTSPGFPEWYEKYTVCLRRFTVAPDTEVVIECSKFATRGGSDCHDDYLQVTISHSGSYEKYCDDDLNNGTTLTVPAWKREYELWFDFYSNRKDHEQGFSCTIIGESEVEGPPKSTTPAGPVVPTEPTGPTGPTEPTVSNIVNVPIGDCECGIANDANIANRIVNGETTEPNEYPWQAALVWRGYPNWIFCGATIINKRFVMTAAHCTNKEVAANFEVKVGEHNTKNNKDGAHVIRVVTIYQHKEFDPTAINTDFSLLELNEELTYSATVRPACLPQDPTVDFVGAKAVVSGWGALDQHPNNTHIRQPDHLQDLTVTVTSNDECGKYPKNEITDKMMCASHPGKDSCQGDSGGPLVTSIDGRYTLIGVVSWGYGCALPDYPGVYARVTTVLEWIKKKTSGVEICYPKST